MHARLEALITVPAGWAGSVDDGGGADVFTVPAGPYYASAFLAALKTALDTATGGTFTVTMASGAGGTGQVTIARAAGNFSITWTSPALRDFLGFTADVSGAATYTSSNAINGVWLPDCSTSGAGLSYAIDGHPRSDAAYSINAATGDVTVWVTHTFYSFRSVRWMLVERSRAIGFGVALVSWQRFVRDCLWGGMSPFAHANGRAPTVKVYSDTVSDTPLGTGDGVYRVVLLPDGEPPQPTPDYDGLWTIEIPELTKV